MPKLIARRSSTAILGTIIIAMLWVGIGVKYFERAHSDQGEAERTNENFAMVFEENVLRTLSELDSALLYMRQNVETRKDTTDYATILRTTQIPGDLIVQTGIIDSKGIIRASTAGPQPTPPIDVSDRDHYRFQRQSPEDRLFISKPVIGRTSGQWSVQLSRRFNASDGSFGGAVVASLNPEHFTSFYDKIDLGSATSIAMIGSDGVVRASGGSASGRFALGQDLTGTSLFTHFADGRNSTFEFKETQEQNPLLIALRKVRGYPLWVSVGVRKADIL